VNPRKPLLALAAALVMPGLGHVYLGDFVSGASLLFAVGLTVPAFARLALWAPSSWLCYVMLLGIVVALVLYAGSAMHACRFAKHAPNAALRSFQRPTVYALYVAVGYVFVLEPVSAHARDHLLETFVVPSASMAPEILPGDRIFADKTVGRSGGAKLERGAIVVFTDPNDTRLTFVKRVVGLPGDRVDIAGASVRVNGADLTLGPAHDAFAALHGLTAMRERGAHGSYVVLWPGASSTTEAPRPTTTYVVPAGSVFVLGDQRAHAVDSRVFGPVPLANVKGIARQIWFSRGPNDGIRWSRIGHLLG
jgi:signal peptidase I